MKLRHFDKPAPERTPASRTGSSPTAGVRRRVRMLDPVADRYEALVMAYFDRLFRRIPRRRPPPQLLRRCKIVSHRGEFDNRRIFENTIPAFDRALSGGVWGLEFDVRWTRDLQPVVIHDPDTTRVLGGGLAIARTCYSDLKLSYPVIPALAEVIQRYGRRAHLMVEIKQEHYPAPEYQNRMLADLLAGLTPQVHYHLISLAPEVLDRFDRLPARTKLPIARLNVDRVVTQVRRQQYGGLLGHYLLINARILRRCRNLNRPVGTGFVNSKNCLFRELLRGVHWVFSDRAAAMQAAVDQIFTTGKQRA